MARKKKEDTINLQDPNEIPFPNPHKKKVNGMITGNPRLTHVLKMIGFPQLDPKNVENIRVMYENEDPCPVYVRFKNQKKFLKLREMPLIEFTFFAGYLGFGDVDRFESGLDANIEAPVLQDPYFGRIITMCLDFPIDVVSLTSETNNYQEEFGEWHDTILRNELTLHAGNGDLLTSPLAEFLKSLQIGTDDEDDDFD